MIQRRVPTNHIPMPYGDGLRVDWLTGFSFITRGAARAEDAQETPTQSHVSPSALVYADNDSAVKRKRNAQASQIRNLI